MPANSTEPHDIVALDVGEARVGIARANTYVKIPEAYAVVATKDALQAVCDVVEKTAAELVVFGLPLLPSGQEGAQAQHVRSFAAQLTAVCPVAQVFVDESFSSLEADRHLSSRQKSTIARESNDAVAACVILQRYFTEYAHV